MIDGCWPRTPLAAALLADADVVVMRWLIGEAWEAFGEDDEEDDEEDEDEDDEHDEELSDAGAA